MYVLHYFPDTASLVVRLALAEMAVPHAFHLIDRENGALDSADYRALHPLGLIPALETPDGPMFETAAILLFLADRHAGLAPAPDSPDRAAFLKWFFFTSSNIHPTLLQIFYPDRVAGEACVPAVLDHAQQNMRIYLNLLEDMVAKDAPGWLSPDRPSILGYYIGVLLRWLAGFDSTHPSYFRCQEFPALHAVLQALETRPAVRAAAAAENLKPTIFTDPY